MKIIFFVSILIILYTFIGYGIVLFILVKIKRLLRHTPARAGDLPTCTVIVAAYNEELIIRQKIANTLSLVYPAGKLDYIFVTDGSTDQTAAYVYQQPEITLLHQPQREGKIAAVHRAVTKVTSDVIVFTDANTMLNPEALLQLCRHYTDLNIGAVAGEKRVQIDAKGDATAGEGFYWKYESQLKSWDFELYSVVGAAGELFSIRKALYEPVPINSVLDDFMISMKIAEKGFRIAYEPNAYAIEESSVNIREELKRKIRISAGGIQSIIQLKSLFNIVKHPVLSFQYISHRVLRWTLTPFLLILAFILNWGIIIDQPGIFYISIALLQTIFYGFAISGMVMESKQVRVKAFFIPYYFCMMNYAVIAGILRYFGTGQPVVWDSAQRKNTAVVKHEAV